MKYKGKELIEMLPENWDGKSRKMLVWDDDTKPIHRMVCGYDPIHCAWLVAETQTVWKHCGEIPTEEDVMKLLNDNEKEILELKEENKRLKDKIESLNSSNYQTHCGMHNVIAKLEDEIADLKKENKELKEKIEPEKKLRRMTYKELDEWLEQGKGVVKIGDKVRDTISYDCESRNQEVSGYYKICGYDEDTWHYPMIEV